MESKNSYTTSEALYHLLGGEAAGWRTMVVRHYSEDHWFLAHTDTGIVVDPTAENYFRLPDYTKALECSFVRKRPSPDAVELMARLLWGLDWPNNLPKMEAQ